MKLYFHTMNRRTTLKKLMCYFFGFASFQILEFLPWLQYFGHEAHKSIIRTRKRSEAFFSKLMEQSMVKKLLIDL